jgi:hypothetical protein
MSRGSDPECSQTFSGAVGQQVLGQLLSHGLWSHVVAMGRREAPVPEEHRQQGKARLEQVMLPWPRATRPWCSVFEMRLTKCLDS